jgi:hypothetical protein
MTWKLYALASGGGLLATYLVSHAPGIEPRQTGSPIVPQAVSATGAVDLTAEAERLSHRVGGITPYHQPARDAFRFGAVARRVPPRPAAPLLETALPPPPPRPLFSLAGIATETSADGPERTAILSSLRGVLLVHEEDIVEGGFRVVAIEDEAVTVESTADGTRTTLRLSGTVSQ